jgi:hypothetical protein
MQSDINYCNRHNICACQCLAVLPVIASFEIREAQERYRCNPARSQRLSATLDCTSRKYGREGINSTNDGVD